jgi:diguanylate cyclase (GGDEF)-like protein
LVAETIARARDDVAVAAQRTARVAQGFRTVARTSALLRQLDRDGVLDAVSDGVVELGYDGVNLAIIDPITDTFEAAHARGIATTFPGRRYPVADGLTGLVRDRGDVVVVDDYQTARHSIEAIRRSGVRLAIGVPVLQNGTLAGVLVASSLRVQKIGLDDVEVLRVLADVAGAALETAEETQAHAHAAHTDELTGLPNRREATQMFGHVRAGDSLALLDLDHFGRVNETHGHAGGDEVLRGFGAHLLTTLRDNDRVARYGGEEFVVVLPNCNLPTATKIIARLMQSWRATAPVTTFSAGLACHQDGRTVEQTLAEADAALYDAKRAGRDTIGPVVDTRITSSSAS